MCVATDVHTFDLCFYLSNLHFLEDVMWRGAELLQIYYGHR